MAPNTKFEADIPDNYDFDERNDEDDPNDEKPTIASPRKYEVLIPHVIYFIHMYVGGLYGMYLLLFEAKWSSVICAFAFYMTTLLGITAGAHRLFSHKSYKATMPLQIILMLFQSSSYQKTIYTWVKLHRLHHKYTDTDADPHNASRGFFYSHIGWLLVKMHPEVKKREKSIYMEDIKSNPVLMFQKRNSQWLLPLIAFVLPTIISCTYGETLWNAWFVNTCRLMVTTNVAFTSNSLTHLWGYKPYDKTISACQNFYFLYVTMGEGFHNYHHVFPWDYRTGETSSSRMNFITMFINFCGILGLVYDKKAASKDMIKSRMKKTGDGTNLWGAKAIVDE